MRPTRVGHRGRIELVPVERQRHARREENHGAGSALNALDLVPVRGEEPVLLDHADVLGRGLPWMVDVVAPDVSCDCGYEREVFGAKDQRYVGGIAMNVHVGRIPALALHVDPATEANREARTAGDVDIDLLRDVLEAALDPDLVGSRA